MIKIITIDREYGSGGAEIAERLAKHLGWKLWDHVLTEEIARLGNCPEKIVEQREERKDPLYYRLFKSFLRGSYEGSLNAHKLNVIDSESILKLAEQIVRHAAKRGHCVIVGRGSQYFLRDRDDTLRIFLYAPREEKVRRLRSRGKSEEEAQELVDMVDQERADFIAKYFHAEWPNRALYHAMINTAAGDAPVTEAILNLMKTFESAGATA
ncbi:MAG TPA: cytidylate kinase-like family protein [Terriglobales bacterium]|jgi:cytidylate kinase|nr:cytidylate kinase-like family protein [Terriglobales bacterium]